MINKYFLPVILLLALSGKVVAQTTEVTGWAAWTHQQKLSSHWGLHLDVQARSADELAYLRNLLFRPGVTYFFDKKKSATLGYLFTNTYRQTAGETLVRYENRIWEQFIVKQTWGRNIDISHRFRLEQRFMGSQGTLDSYFAQRARYFIRGIIPFNRDSVFNKGTYAAFQNELFFNVQNKRKVNGDFFDQNRAYLGIGYRFNKKVDAEIGYLNQYVNATGPINTLNNVIQLSLFTRFGK